MVKNPFKHLALFLASTAVGIALLLSFQNCSRTNFSSVSSTSKEANSTPAGSPSVSGPNIRTKTLYPSSTTQANPGRVKALIVIDNSGSMAASQQNLSNTITPLLTELARFNAEVRLTSTTFHHKACDTGSGIDPKCTTSAVFNLQESYSSPINADGSQTFNSFKRYDLNTFMDFKYDPTMSDIQKQSVSIQIKTKISDFGTKGSPNETPFATVMTQIFDANFFKENDKALIFIVTDEDDSISISTLMEPKFYQSSTTIAHQSVPGYQIKVSGYMYSGSCTSQGENGSGGSSVSIGPIISQTLEGCNAHISTIQNCSYSCYSTWKMMPESEGYELGSRSLAEACAESKNSLQPFLKYEDCISKAHIKRITTSESLDQNWFLGLTAGQITEMKGLNHSSRKSRFAQLFKDRLNSRVGEKYFFQVVTNIPGQSCGVSGYQSMDNFFQSLKPELPAQNYKVSSICSQDGTSSESIARLAEEFITVINSDYAIGLLPNEVIQSVRLKLKNQSSIIELKLGEHYEIRNGQLILLDQSLLGFERIDIEIKSN